MGAVKIFEMPGAAPGLFWMLWALDVHAKNGRALCLCVRKLLLYHNLENETYSNYRPPFRRISSGANKKIGYTVQTTTPSGLGTSENGWKPLRP
jgi:hypothetical protein